MTIDEKKLKLVCACVPVSAAENNSYTSLSMCNPIYITSKNFNMKDVSQDSWWAICSDFKKSEHSDGKHWESKAMIRI